MAVSACLFTSVVIVLHHHYVDAQAISVLSSDFYDNCLMSKINYSRVIELRLAAPVNNGSNILNFTAQVCGSSIGICNDKSCFNEVPCKMLKYGTVQCPIMDLDDYLCECLNPKLLKAQFRKYAQNGSVDITHLNFEASKCKVVSCIRSDFAPENLRFVINYDSTILVSYNAPDYSHSIGSKFRVAYKETVHGSFRLIPKCAEDYSCSGPRCKCAIDTRHWKPCVNYTVCVQNTMCGQTVTKCKQIMLKTPVPYSPKMLQSYHDGSILHIRWQKQETDNTLDILYKYRVVGTAGKIFENVTTKSNISYKISCGKDRKLTVMLSRCLSCICGAFTHKTVDLVCKPELYVKEIVIPVVGVVFLLLLYKFVSMVRRSRLQKAHNHNQSQGSVRKIVNLDEIVSNDSINDCFVIEPRHDYDYPSVYASIYHATQQNMQEQNGHLGPAAFDVEEEDPYIHDFHNVLYVKPAEVDA